MVRLGVVVALIVLVVGALAVIGVIISKESKATARIGVDSIERQKRREEEQNRAVQQTNADGERFYETIKDNPITMKFAEVLSTAIKDAISKSVDASLKNYIHGRESISISSTNIFTYRTYSEIEDSGWTWDAEREDHTIYDNKYIFIRYSNYNMQTLGENFKIYGLTLALTKLLNERLQNLALPNVAKCNVSVNANAYKWNEDFTTLIGPSIGIVWDAWQDKYIEL